MIRSTTPIGAKSGRRQLKSEAMEHTGGEDTLTEKKRRGSPKVADSQRFLCPIALRISRGDCASELGLPFQEGRSEDCSASSSNQDGSHPMHRATKRAPRE
jgi:hypothetical protein